MTDTRRPRILIITRNLPPLIGGMERLNWHMAGELSQRAAVRIIAPQGSAACAPPGVEVIEIPLHPLWKFLVHAQWRGLREARHWRPEVVLACSGLTALPALIAARTSGARAIAYVHGLDLTVPHIVYRKLWLPALHHMDRVIANSRATAELAERAGVKPARLGIVHPGVEIPQNLPDARAVARFRAEHGLAEQPLLISVGRLSARKGLREFVADALPQIVAKYPRLVLLIAGDAPSDALHAQAQTPESIRAAAEQAGVADNVRFLGSLTDAELAAAYCAANVHVFPVREIAGDMEGFGMVAIEAAAHGLPTVAFATGGVVDAVADGQSGHLVPSGDYRAFAKTVLQTLVDRDALRAGCITFAQRFAWPNFGTQINAQLWDIAAPSCSSGASG